jgi:hypothetical protein
MAGVYEVPSRHSLKCLSDFHKICQLVQESFSEDGEDIKRLQAEQRSYNYTNNSSILLPYYLV